MKYFICFLVGHKLEEKYNDSGYLVCKRCGAHEYYDGAVFNEVSGKWRDGKWGKAGYLKKIFNTIIGFFKRKNIKCIDNDDLPF